MQLGAFIDADLLKARPYCGMIHFRRAARVFGLAIGNAKPVIEELVIKPLHRDVREPVDCRRKYRTAGLLEVLGEVRSTAQKADTYRGLSDDHLKEIPILRNF